MAAALMRHLFGKFVYVDSAGARAGELDPMAVEVMDEMGIEIGKHKPRSFDDLDLALLESVVPPGARAIASARLLAEERWQRQKAELMFQASKAIHTELDFDQALREVALLLKQAIRVPWVGLFQGLPDQERQGQMRLVASTAEPAVELRICSTPWSLPAWAEAHGEQQAAAPPSGITLPAELACAIGQPGTVWQAFPLSHQLGLQGLLVVGLPRSAAGPTAEAVEVAIAVAELVALAMTNQVLMEQDARARNQIIRSQAAAQEREVLLRQIVHDLRNATQAMSLVVEDMAIDLDEHSPLQAGLATLDSQISFISNFLKEKLRWIQHGERGGDERRAAIADVFADLQARFAPAARAKQQRLVVLPPEPVEVAVSTVQLGQIVGNLLDNAIKFTQAGGEVRLRADTADGWVTIYVSDNGPGIKPDVQARLGEVGYRGDTRAEGTGLGLSNVRQLVTEAGGLFGCSSRLAIGSSFHVSLPTTLWGRIIS